MKKIINNLHTIKNLINFENSSIEEIESFITEFFLTLTSVELHCNINSPIWQKNDFEKLSKVLTTSRISLETKSMQNSHVYTILLIWQ